MIKKLSCVATVLMAMIFVGCPKGRSPNPPVIVDQNMCAAACNNIGPKGLNCEEGKPINVKRQCASTAQCSRGETCESGWCSVSCEQFCVDTENQGVWLDPTCVAKITSCDQVDACPLPGKLTLV